MGVHVLPNDFHGSADPEIPRSGFHQVAGETSLISAVEFHHSHDVGQYLGRGRMELLMHDRPGEEAATPIDFLPRRIKRMTERTDRSRWVAIGVARRAAVHYQPVLSGRLEERLRQGVDRRPGHGVGEPARAHVLPSTMALVGIPGELVTKQSSGSPTWLVACPRSCRTPSIT